MCVGIAVLAKGSQQVAEVGILGQETGSVRIQVTGTEVLECGNACYVIDTLCIIAVGIGNRIVPANDGGNRLAICAVAVLNLRVANGVDQFRDRASSIVLIRVDLPVLVHGCTLDAILIDVGVGSGVSIFFQNLDVLGINVIDIAGQDVVFLFVGSINAVGHKQHVPDQAQVVIGRAVNREGFYRLGFFRLGWLKD